MPPREMLICKTLDRILRALIIFEGIAKGPKVDAVLEMLPPRDVPTLKSLSGLSAVLQ